MHAVEVRGIRLHLTCVTSNSYSALSVQYGSNTARGPRASAMFEAISHTKRTITIIYSVTMAP